MRRIKSSGFAERDLIGELREAIARRGGALWGAGCTYEYQPEFLDSFMEAVELPADTLFLVS